MRSAILGAALLLGACTGANGEHGERAEAHVAQRSFEVGPFQSVALEGSHDVVVTVGGAPSVRAEGDSEALERLDIRVENGTLKIGNRRDGMFSGFRHHRGVTVHVTAPSLNAAQLAGSGDMRIDRAQAETFEASVLGSGDMEIAALQARRAEFNLAGPGGIRAGGAVDQAEISVAGSGDVGLDSLQTRRASVSVAGSGDVSLRASEAVEGSILGSGDLTVHGTARCSVSKMGSGDIRCGG